MINTYGTLKARLREIIARTDLDADVPFFIQEAEKRIASDIRCRWTEKGANFTLTDGLTVQAGLIPVPDDYREMKLLYEASTPNLFLIRKTLEQIHSEYAYSSGGCPRVYARTNIEYSGASLPFFYIAPVPSATADFRGVYHFEPDAMSDDADNPWTVRKEPYLILNAALVSAYSFARDVENEAIAEAKYQNIKNRLNEEYRKEDYSGSSLETRIAR